MLFTMHSSISVNQNDDTLLLLFRNKYMLLATVLEKQLFNRTPTPNKLFSEWKYFDVTFYLDVFSPFFLSKRVSVLILG